jgi:FkbH-like protein
VDLLLQNFPRRLSFSQGLKVTPITSERGIALLDQRWEIIEGENQTLLNCEYSTDLFEESTIQELVKNYGNILEKLVENPNLKIVELEISQALKQQAQKARQRDKKQTIVVAATFTADPIEASLSYWMEKLSLPSEIQLASYNQVFQELLNPESAINQNQEGVNLTLLRPEDWVRFDSKIHNQSEKWKSKIRQTSNDLIAILQQANSSLKVPLILVICPPSSHLESEQINFLRRIEALMTAQLKPLNRLHVITSSKVAAIYPVADYYDANRDELGHIPYTETYYATLGTAIARKIYALKHPPYKVIVLDCDNTLWTGICGEDGAKGVRIDESRQILQTLLVEQQKAGKLLCLCSKNQEDDVWAVFDAQGEMPLKKEHLVSWQINWQPKSEGLKALAQELNLGLDSFIFIDDNPVECAEVQANCPEVLTLQLPENLAEIPQFLQHIWAFDLVQTTSEDQKRTEMYRENLAREQLKRESLTFNDFLASLNLEISTEAVNPDNLPRVSQLTQRTNQFNLTTIRRSEGEIQELLDKQELDGRVISVKDRFGDYGLVGVLLFNDDKITLTVDTFLLSCLVLGRGVKDEMVKTLSKIAQEKNLDQIKIPY